MDESRKSVDIFHCVNDDRLTIYGVDHHIKDELNYLFRWKKGIFLTPYCDWKNYALGMDDLYEYQLPSPFLNDVLDILFENGFRFRVYALKSKGSKKGDEPRISRSIGRIFPERNDMHKDQDSIDIFYHVNGELSSIYGIDLDIADEIERYFKQIFPHDATWLHDHLRKRYVTKEDLYEYRFPGSYLNNILEILFEYRRRFRIFIQK